MTRVDELCTDLQLLISEHKALELAVEENNRMKNAIQGIKAEIRQKQWHIGVDSANQVIEIIDKHISGKENTDENGD